VKVEHRIITQGPMNARDWRITCLCLRRFIGVGAKDAKAKWQAHLPPSAGTAA
jgi:hypothetical protein